MIQDMDTLPWVADRLQARPPDRKVFHRLPAGILTSACTAGRGLPGAMHLLPLAATIGGHKYRVPLAAECVPTKMAYMKSCSRRSKEFFFDDDTFTANLPRAREIAKKLGPLGVHWSCNSRANLDYDTIKSFKDNGLRLFLVGYEAATTTSSPASKRARDDGREMRRVHQVLPSGRRGDSRHVHSPVCRVETRQSIENTINFAEGT